jgi:sodium transport system ATP-binding protein
MRQRAALARTLLHDPPVLILDEPTSGLDVPTARVIEEFILQARRSGKCILYSTHVMEEAEFLCDRIAVIDEVRIRITGTMQELKAATGHERLREIFLALLASQQEQAAAQ